MTRGKTTSGGASHLRAALRSTMTRWTDVLFSPAATSCHASVYCPPCDVLDKQRSNYHRHCSPYYTGHRGCCRRTRANTVVEAAPTAEVHGRLRLPHCNAAAHALLELYRSCGPSPNEWLLESKTLLNQ